MALTTTKRKDPFRTILDLETDASAAEVANAFRAFQKAGGRSQVGDAVAAFDAAAPGNQFDAFFAAADAPGSVVQTVSDVINGTMNGTGGSNVTNTGTNGPPLPTPASTPTTTTTPTIDEGALLNEVMGAIRSDPMAFSSGAGLNNFRLGSGQSLNELPQNVQNQMNAFLGGNEYSELLGAAQDRDPGIQLQRMRDEQAAREKVAQQEVQERTAREVAATQALATQQAPTSIQASTVPIEIAEAPMAADVTNAATFVEGVPLQAEAVEAPAVNLDTGLNTAILSRLADLSEQSLKSDNELRRNQQMLLADIQNQAEAAGKSAVEGLTLPDLTAVSVPARQLSPMEQALDTRLTDRLTGGRFLDPQSALTNEAEAQALERLQRDSFLGGSAGLDAAERRAMARLTDPALLGDLDSDLITGAEGIIAQRLLGGESPAMAAQRARVEERYGQSMEEGRELLNRLGVLRGGDSADIFNELTRGRDQQMLDVDALGYDLQTQALQDALNFQGRRDALAQAEQAFQRGAISDVAGLAGQRDERAMAEEALRRQAISDTLPFQQRRDALSMAEQDLQRAAISDAMARQGMVDQRDLSEAQLSGSLRGAATLPARMAQAGLQFDAANLQQDVADRTLARLLTQTEPTQRERFEEGVRAAREQERLAARADLRQAQALQDQLYGEVSGIGSAPARTTLTGQSFNQDRLNQELQRQLARSADLRAAQAQEAELFGEVGGVGSDPSIRRTRAAEIDDFNRALARAGLTGVFEGEQTQDALTNELQRQLARSADLRAAQAQEADLFGEVGGVGSDPSMRRTLAGRQFESAEARAERALREDELTARLQRDLATAGVTGIFDRQETQQAQEARLARAMQNRQLDMQARQLREDELTARLQRELAEADVTGVYDRAPTRQANLDAFNRRLAEAGLTGQYRDEATLAGRQDARAAQALESDLLTAQLQRLLSQQAQDAELFGEVGGTGSDPTVRRTRQGEMDDLARAADARAEQALESDLLSAQQQRLLQRQAQDAELFGEVGGTGSDPTIRQTRRAQLEDAAETRAQEGFKDDLLTAALNRTLARAGDLRAGQAQDAALFGVVGGEGSDPTMRPTMAREAMDLSQRNQLISQILAAADLTQGGRLDEFAAALGAESDNPLITEALANALQLDMGNDPDNPEITSTLGPNNPPFGAYKDALGNLRDREGHIINWSEEDQNWVRTYG